MVLFHKLTLQILDLQPYFCELYFVKAPKLRQVRIGQYLDENLQGGEKKRRGEEKRKTKQYILRRSCSICQLGLTVLLFKRIWC